MNKGRIPFPTWTGFPNLVIDSLPDYTSGMIRVLLVISRRTVGYHRRWFRSSVLEMADLTGLSHQGVQDAARRLTDKNMIHRVQDGGKTIWALSIASEHGERECPLCGRHAITHYAGQDQDVEKVFCNHHIIPLVHGGIAARKNTIVICHDCHALVHQWIDHEIAKLDAEETPVASLFKRALSANMRSHFDSTPISGGLSDDQDEHTTELYAKTETMQLSSMDHATQLHDSQGLKERKKETNNPWEEIKKQLRDNMSKDAYDARIQGTWLIEATESGLVIGCYTEKQQRWLQERMTTLVSRIAAGILARDRSRLTITFTLEKEAQTI